MYYDLFYISTYYLWINVVSSRPAPDDPAPRPRDIYLFFLHLAQEQRHARFAYLPAWSVTNESYQIIYHNGLRVEQDSKSYLPRIGALLLCRDITTQADNSSRRSTI
ncbi:uncharacterized protein H6S33_006325 [Morchella sextelata]|uniref:uncharacterized protein n=1 Tax=Morchella sextelata TaxID=1174677 RepID=UPI001D04CBC6|nr:uncharacterized protein H6S33_006325 [Morchella sextelata]KAH0604657.1 hypothetical protein H6S33_006325 [Morchella sextelata]